MKIIFLFLALGIYFSYGQKILRDSVERTFMMSANYKGSLSGGDLADRWGFHNGIGLDFDYKFKNSLTVGFNGSFLFGSGLRDTTVFKDVFNTSGTITSLSGNPAQVLLLMRGVTAYATVGYVFNRFGNNPNSGIWVNGGVGFMSHKIRIEAIYDEVPQIQGDLKYGYDRLTMGFSTKQFIGYLYQSDWRLLKFYGGFEFTQGFTQNIRNYNFDLGGPDPTNRIDLQYGLKVGWIIPIAQRTRGQYYFD
ncbi:hypothetical protein N8987_02305 [Crocinitomix sp.]|nr:hypothetical protein [Crocinitomix sp.]